MKKIILIVSIILVVGAFVSTVIIMNNKSIALSEELKAMENELAMTNEKLKKTEEELSDKSEKVTILSDLMTEKNTTITRQAAAFRDLIEYQPKNIFMGEWRVVSAMYEIGAYKQNKAKADEITAEYAGKILKTESHTLSFFGVDYDDDEFDYKVALLNRRIHFFTIGFEMPFEIDGKETDYTYSTLIFGYENGRMKWLGDIVLKDENTAYMNCSDSKRSNVYLKLERISYSLGDW